MYGNYRLQQNTTNIIRINTAQQRTIIRQYLIGTLAVDGWAVTFGTARRGLGGLRPRSAPSPLLAVPNVTAHLSTATNFISFDVAL